MFYGISVVVLGFLLDFVLGDPVWMPHPVRWMGWLIAKMEPVIRRVLPKSEKGCFWGGALLAVLTCAVFTAGAGTLIWAAGKVHRMLGFFVEVWICYQMLAAKSLKTESMKVYEQLKKGDLQAARKALSMIVGRDTEHLSPEQVVKAAVETVAENTSDGVIAPLFYLLLGGAPLGVLYKAVNTLDSMIGYKNERYLFFGRFAARLDDLLNWIPARLTAIFMAASALFCGLDGAGAWRIWKRDRRKHPSPNSAQAESACAGALGIQLGGASRYQGVLVEKPALGDATRPAATGDIPAACKLMYLASVMGLAVLGLLKMMVLFLL